VTHRRLVDPEVELGSRELGPLNSGVARQAEAILMAREQETVLDHPCAAAEPCQRGHVDVKARVLCAWLAASALWGGALVTSLNVSAQEEGVYRPPPAPEQPIPFSHAQHAPVVASCVDCHKGGPTDARAGFPPTAQCMTCHTQASTPALKALADFAAAGEVPWRRVVRVPDYVFFNHKTHMSARETTCDTCHGKVQEMTATQKVYDMSMAACIECHKQRRAPETCDPCHEPRG
jgi:hypothetical protein